VTSAATFTEEVRVERRDIPIHKHPIDAICHAKAAHHPTLRPGRHMTPRHDH
jgi:hypothetical protein